MNQRSGAGSLLARGWLPLVAVIAMSVGAAGMWKVHQSSVLDPVVTVLGPQAPEQFTQKRLTYEMFGTLGDGGLLSYVDVDGHPHQVELATLPWSDTETTTLTVVSGSISAQVHGGEVGCRILVNDVVHDEQSATRPNADVTCRVKSA